MTIRARGDLCPGVLRPWPAADGLLVRLRLIGGLVSTSSLRALSDVSAAYGDGRIHLTSRANLQLRGLPGSSSALDPRRSPPSAATGLLPSPTHELVRNVLVSARPRRASPTCGRSLPSLDALLVRRSAAGVAVGAVPVRARRRSGGPARSGVRPRAGGALVVGRAAPGRTRVRAGGPARRCRVGAGRAGARVRRTTWRRGCCAVARLRAARPAGRPGAPDPRLPSPSAPLPFGRRTQPSRSRTGCPATTSTP